MRIIRLATDEIAADAATAVGIRLSRLGGEDRMNTDGRAPPVARGLGARGLNLRGAEALFVYETLGVWGAGWWWWRSKRGRPITSSDTRGAFRRNNKTGKSRSIGLRIGLMQKTRILALLKIGF